MAVTLPTVVVEGRGPLTGEQPDIPLVVRLPLLNRETTAVTEWSISSGFMTSTDGFEFTLYDENRDNVRGLELQPVELVLDGSSQLIGRIDTTRLGDNGTAVSCSGRDYIADMVECNIDPSLKIKSGDNLFTVIQLAASPVGINTIISDEDLQMAAVRSGKKPKAAGKKRSRKATKLNEFKPEPGQGIYDFLNKIIAREGATIQPGTSRNELVIAEPTYDQEPLYKIFRSANRDQGGANNIESGVAVRDYSKFPTYTLMQGQQARGGEKSANVQTAVDIFNVSASFQSSELIDAFGRAAVADRWKPGTTAGRVFSGGLYRLLHFRDEIARDGEQVEKAAKRAIAERLRDTLSYHCTVRGHIDPGSGAIYSVDTIIRVDDEIANVHENLWIAERTLRYSAKDGATTELVCWRPDSFQLN